MTGDFEGPKELRQIVSINNERVNRRQMGQSQEIEHFIRKGADMLLMSGSEKWWLLTGWPQKVKNLVHKD